MEHCKEVINHLQWESEWLGPVTKRVKHVRTSLDVWWPHQYRSWIAPLLISVLTGQKNKYMFFVVAGQVMEHCKEIRNHLQWESERLGPPTERVKHVRTSLDVWWPHQYRSHFVPLLTSVLTGQKKKHMFFVVAGQVMEHCKEVINHLQWESEWLGPPTERGLHVRTSLDVWWPLQYRSPFVPLLASVLKGQETKYMFFMVAGQVMEHCKEVINHLQWESEWLGPPTEWGLHVRTSLDVWWHLQYRSWIVLLLASVLKGQEKKYMFFVVGGQVMEHCRGVRNHLQWESEWLGPPTERVKHVRTSLDVWWAHQYRSWIVPLLTSVLTGQKKKHMFFVVAGQVMEHCKEVINHLQWESEWLGPPTERGLHVRTSLDVWWPLQYRSPFVPLLASVLKGQEKKYMFFIDAGQVMEHCKEVINHLQWESEWLGPPTERVKHVRTSLDVWWAHQYSSWIVPLLASVLKGQETKYMFFMVAGQVMEHCKEVINHLQWESEWLGPSTEWGLHVRTSLDVWWPYQYRSWIVLLLASVLKGQEKKYMFFIVAGQVMEHCRGVINHLQWESEWLGPPTERVKHVRASLDVWWPHQYRSWIVPLLTSVLTGQKKKHMFFVVAGQVMEHCKEVINHLQWESEWLGPPTERGLHVRTSLDV